MTFILKLLIIEFVAVGKGVAFVFHQKKNIRFTKIRVFSFIDYQIISDLEVHVQFVPRNS